MSDKADVLRGTLDLLILRTLALEPMHGFGIGRRIKQVSQDVFQLNQGSLYPALNRLERHGLIAAEWSESDNNRRARYYRLTRAGRRGLSEATADWQRVSDAINRILQMA